MSIRVLADIWENGPNDKSEILILLALADYSNDAGECWPAMASIARKARMTERGAQKIVSRLIETGWLEVEAGGGRKNCNLYTIRNPEPRSPRTPFTPNVVTETPNPVPINPEPRSPEPSLNQQEPSIEPLLIPLEGKSRRPKRKPEVELPQGWVPNEKNIQDAEAKGFTQKEIDHEADSFRNHHHSKQSLYRDWDAAWRTWINNAIKFGRRSGMAGKAAPYGHGQGSSLASIAAQRRFDGSV